MSFAPLVLSRRGFAAILLKVPASLHHRQVEAKAPKQWARPQAPSRAASSNNSPPN